jgi:FAD/FMN-containing dehydrogenase
MRRQRRTWHSESDEETIMTAISDRTLDGLGRRLAGELVRPADPGWEVARAAWNLTADLQPAAVAVPATTADVCAVVDTARGAGLRVAALATGHGAVPLAGLEDTILLKTSRLRAVRVDAEHRRATAAGGDVWLDVTRPASDAGLAPLAGSSPDVGVAGYTLGGGLGWLGRRHGLACNSVTAFQVVTADGRPRRVDHRHDPDVFWALRGGGGNFGVVTELEFTLHPVADLYAGWLVWPLAQAGSVLAAWLDWLADIPETVTSTFRLMRYPPIPALPDAVRGRDLLLVEAAILGDDETGDRLLRPLRALRPELDTFAAAPPAALSRLHMDPEQPVAGVADQALLGDLPPAATDALMTAAGPDSGSPLLAVELRHLGGALARPDPRAGALATLDGSFALLTAGATTPDTVVDMQATATALVEALRPWQTGRGYTNFAETLPVDPRTLFPPAVHQRLTRIKADIDPDGLFLANHPIDATSAR